MRFICTPLLLSSVLLACGDDGAPGTPGAVGAPGKEGNPGAIGPAGTPGVAGNTGSTGDKGDTGEKGDPGAAGPAGGVKTLAFDAPSVVTAFTINTAVVPTPCRTAAYVAGAGESAIVDMGASVVPLSAVNTLLSITVATAENGGAFAAVSTTSNDQLQGAANPSVRVLVPLAQGISYVFGAMLEAGATFNVGASSCSGTVTIAKTQ